MDGWLKVLFPASRTVYVDGVKYDATGTSFSVQLGTHTIDLGEPRNYKPASVTRMIDGTPTNPTIITFEPAV